ncbi:MULTISPECIES: hypothetical protein [unclassified Duganella]|uniref:hypothetical protein n=1 Tax=unclassified Duganella TaxID=2636909 RepID=UPI000E351A75|nr:MULTISPECIES: hypothetical protein [unclassified Duganella]RFP08962.1 hypothetical protein D0T23_27665 [Duganella sp. BJB475]RFP23927.1 hypothetical protein D0T21_28660 [Duganella sp. BJB476]
MPLTFNEEIALQAAFMHIKRERKESLRAMFNGTQLRAKSRVEDAKTLAKDAKDCKKKLGAIPGVAVPHFSVPQLNIDLFKGLDLRGLVDFRIPAIGLPNFDINLIPNIRLGAIPGFNLPTVRLNLKGLIKFKDLLPDISLRALVFKIGLTFPELNMPSLLFDLSKILNIDFDVAFPRIRDLFPDFFNIDLNVSLPHLAIPDISLPNVNLPTLDLPNINLGEIDFSKIHIPGFDFPTMLKVPGFDKVLRLLFELFDSLDINVILAELGVEFMADFISSALPLVQQVKAGAKAAGNWGTAAMDWHKARKTTVQRGFLLPGDARDACDAVADLLRTSRNEHAALAAIQTTQLAVSTAGLFADLGGVTGPAVAAASAIATTCQKIMIMGARYKEMKKVNLILSNSAMDALSSNIFLVSPLLGCYYLANNSTSSVLNILCNNIIEDGWMAQWEQNKRQHLDPLLTECARFISESRYVLDPVRQNKGMFVEKSGMDKLKEGLTLYLKKKAGMAPAHARVATHKYVG